MTSFLLKPLRVLGNGTQSKGSRFARGIVRNLVTRTALSTASKLPSKTIILAFHTSKSSLHIVSSSDDYTNKLEVLPRLTGIEN